MRRALFISPFIWEAGPYKGKPTVYYTLRGFQHAGYGVHLVTATNKPGLRDVVYEGIQVHYFQIPFNPVDFEYDALESFLTLVRRETSLWKRHLKFRLFWTQFVTLGTWRAMQVARQWPPALTYGVTNCGIPIAYIIGRRQGVPNFSRITGSPLLNWTGSTIKLYLARFDELLAFKLPCDALIMTEDGSMTIDDIHQRLGVPINRIWLWRNGVDKAAFVAGPDRDKARQALRLEPDAKVVLSVSQLVDLKRIERIVEAAPQVVQQCPTTRFLIVGDGPERAVLQQRAKHLGVEHLVRFEGFVTRDKLPLYYRASDIFAAFYDYANVSNSLLEAMLSGNAVVTLDNGHTRNVVQHLENGLLVDPTRLSDIPAALVRVLTDDDLRHTLGRNAAAYADRTLLTWDERIAREIIAIEAILANRDSNCA